MKTPYYTNIYVLITHYISGLVYRNVISFNLQIALLVLTTYCYTAELMILETRLDF